MKRLIYSLIIGAGIIAATSCESGSVGSSISQAEVQVVMDSTFTLTGSSIKSERIASRTAKQLLGVIKSDNFGELSSEFVTQFLPSTYIDTVGTNADLIDSVKFVMRIPAGGFTGDSIVPMGVKVYELNKQLPSPIYSDFIPVDYYDAAKPLGSTSYVATKIAESDSLQKLSYRDIEVPLPLEFAQRIYNAYYDDPLMFDDPAKFALNACPGFFVTTSFGSGRMMYVGRSTVRFYYRKLMKTDASNDTTYYRNIDYLAASPEVINNNIINLTLSPSITKRIDDGEVIIQAPIGNEVALTFPAQEIIDKYLITVGDGLGVLNNVYLEIPAEAIASSEGINPPPYLLLLRASEKDTFFATGSITDSEESFYAAYNSTTKSYIFQNLRKYIMGIIEDNNGIADANDCALLLTPVNVESESASSYSTSTTITAVSPYVNAPAIAKLNLNKAKIKIVFSNQHSD